MLLIDNQIQVRLHPYDKESHILTVREFLETQHEQPRILTPKGFIPFRLVEYTPQTIYQIQLIAKGTDKYTVNLAEEAQVKDFMNQEYISPYQIQQNTNILLYTNTNTDCRGFHIKRTVGIVTDIIKLPDTQSSYRIQASHNSVWIDRAECKIC